MCRLAAFTMSTTPHAYPSEKYHDRAAYQISTISGVNQARRQYLHSPSASYEALRKRTRVEPLMINRMTYCWRASSWHEAMPP